MTFSTTPRLGVDLASVLTAADVTAGRYVPQELGVQVWANDGKRYVYAKAGGSIPASTAVCTVNPSTFVATATGGSYGSPATAMASGDYGWFAAASV